MQNYMFPQVLRTPVFSTSASVSASAESWYLSPVGNWRTPETSTLSVSPPVIAWIERSFTLRERLRVLAFLEQYPFLASILVEAVGEIRKQFPDSPLILKVVSDPEGDSPDTLGLYVSTNLEPEEALKRLNQVADDWWLDKMHEAQGRLFLNLEF